MKFKSLIILTFVFQIYQIKAQHIEFDKLDSLVDIAISISNNALYEARFPEAKNAIAIKYFENFLDIKRKHKIQLMIQDLRVDGFNNIVFQKKSNPKEDFKKLALFRPYVDEIEEKEIRANFYLTFSGLHRLLKNVDSSVVYETKAMQLFQEMKRLDKIAEIRASQISRKHNQYLNDSNKKEILKLIQNYTKEIEFSTRHSKYALSYNTRHLAQIHLKQTFDYNKALKLFKESLQLREEIGFKLFIPASYSSIGDVYLKLGKYKLAEEMYLTSIKIADEIGFVRYQCNPYLYIGDVYLTQGNKAKAIEHYSKALKSARSNNYRTGINDAIKKINSLKN